jgi:hypothetical protein
MKQTSTLSLQTYMFTETITLHFELFGCCAGYINRLLNVRPKYVRKRSRITVCDGTFHHTLQCA